MGRKDWGAFWAGQATPCHAVDDEGFYRDLAREILFHTGSLAGSKVLELGCGNGAVSAHLDIDPQNYTGVDFSGSLLDQFRTRAGNLNLVEQDILGFLRANDCKYDVIISFGVLQYLGRAEMAELFQLQAQALDEGGQCAHFALPVRDLAGVFYSGLGSAHRLGMMRPRGLLKRLWSRLGNRIGNWYCIDEIYRMSETAGFATRLVSNINYFYRVNLLQRLPASGGGA